MLKIVNPLVRQWSDYGIVQMEGIPVLTGAPIFIPEVFL